jgi:hypothetical protein
MADRNHQMVFLILRMNVGLLSFLHYIKSKQHGERG